MKYLRWLICVFREHIWTDPVVAYDLNWSDKIELKRFTCARCGMYRFEQLS